MPVAFEREPGANGGRLICLAPHVLNRFRALRGPGESYSDVIFKLVELEAKGELLLVPNPPMRASLGGRLTG